MVASRVSRVPGWVWDWRLWAGLSIALAVTTGIGAPLGIASLACTALAAAMVLQTRGAWKVLAAMTTVVLCIALGAHLLPGIHNPLLFSRRLSPGASEYRLFWNFDHAFGGFRLPSPIEPLRGVLQRTEGAKAFGILGPDGKAGNGVVAELLEGSPLRHRTWRALRPDSGPWIRGLEPWGPRCVL